MAPDDYWSERGRLGAALRSLLWERRAVREMFRHTSDPDLLRCGVDWLKDIWDEERRLCRSLRELDIDFQESNGDTWNGS